MLIAPILTTMNLLLITLFLFGARGQVQDQAEVEPVAEPQANPLATLKAFAAVPLDSPREILVEEPQVAKFTAPSYRSNFVTKGQKSIAEIGGLVSWVKPSTVEVKDISDNIEDIPLSPNCPTHFGLFEVKGSCRQYYHCRLGVDYISECPSNTVFEVAVETCVHPDQSSRSECSGPSVHQFECPRYNLVNGFLPLLRFGDHDRLAHPSDCSKFFACLLNGQPRLASCPKPTAFSVESGFCTNYKLVKGCERFYDDVEEEVKEQVQSFDSEAVRSFKSVNFFNFANSV